MMPFYVIALIIGAVLVAISAVLCRAKFKLTIAAPVLLGVATLVLGYQLWRHLPFISWMLGVWALLAIGLVLMLLKPRLLSVVASVSALVLLAIFGIGSAVVNWSSSSETPSSNSTSSPATTTPAPNPTSTAPAAMSDALKAILTVSDGLENCTDIVSASGTTVVSGVYNLHIDALLPAGDGTNGTRKWSDAMGTPVKGDTPQAQLTDVKSTICSDPLLGVTVANWFANMTIEGAKLSDLNNWLLPYAGSVSQIEGWTASFVPTFGVKNPSDAQLNAQLDATRKYQDLANRLVTLVDRAQLAGVSSPPNVLNYHLAGAGATAGVIPPVELNPNPDSLQALVLQFTEKGACAPAAVIGFNVGDKRPETFAVPSCVTPTPTTPTTPGHNPTPKPTPTPTPKPTPTPTPTCPPTTCLQPKNPADDVTPPAGTTQQGAGVKTSPTQGTGVGTSGNAATNGTPSSDAGSSVPVQDASPAPAPSSAPDPTVSQAPAGGTTAITNPDGP